MSWATKIVIVIVVVGLAAGGIYYWKFAGEAPPTFRTAAVTRGDLLATISATGTVMPEEQVDVGAQVNGQILSFGADDGGKLIDYDSHVEAGMVLAKIDDALYRSSVESNQAALELARAGLVRAQADLGQMDAKLVDAQRDWDRAQKLHNTEALAETQYDAYQSAYETAKAMVEVDKAAILQAKATVDQAQANLDQARRNLEYCTIKSPVKGVIIDRRVNIGQTVVSAMSVSSLFLIAKDLKQMQVWVQVNEADIANIYPSQPVTFAVDARPGETFKGTVGKVRLNAQQTQNVVTYTVEVLTDNSGGQLLPYQTANVQFVQSHPQDVLQVPNAALRWFPQPEMIAPEFVKLAQDLQKPRSAGEQKRSGSTSGPASGTASGAPNVGAAASTRADGHRHHNDPATMPAGGSEAGASTRPALAGATTSPAAGPLPPRMVRGVLWVRYGKFVKPIKVRAGVSDGTNTEVQSDELTEGMEVIVDQLRASAASGGASNPFTPQIPRGGRR